MIWSLFKNVIGFDSLMSYFNYKKKKKIFEQANMEYITIKKTHSQHKVCQ